LGKIVYYTFPWSNATTILVTEGQLRHTFDAWEKALAEEADSFILDRDNARIT
jgi:hypothetical protein